MKVKCPKCKMISVVEEDRIITTQTALQLLCHTCDLPMELKIQVSIHRQDTRRGMGIQPPASDFLDIDPPDTDSLEAYLQISQSSMALKIKILRNLVTPPPIAHIILKAHEILADANSSLNDLAKVIEADLIEPRSIGARTPQELKCRFLI